MSFRLLPCISGLTPLVYAGGIISCGIAYPMVKRFGKDKTLKILLALSVISSLIRWVTMDSSLVIVIGMSAIFSVASNLFLLLMTPMLMDCVDYGEYITFEREEGVIMSVSSFSQKFGMALAGFVIGLIFDASGFVEGATTQSQSALDGIFFVNIALPTILYAISFIMLILYKLNDKKMIDIHSELSKRN